MNNHRVCSKINTMGATCEAGTAYPSWVLKLIPDVSCGSCCSIFVSCLVFCRSMFVLLLSVIALTVLRITASDYLFGIFKLFVNDINLDITYKFNNSHQTVIVGFSLVPGYAYLLYLFKTLLMAPSSKTLTFPFPANLHHYDVMTMTQVTQIERGRRGCMDLQLPMQSVPITTNVVSSNPADGEEYWIQHYVIKFVSVLWQFGGFPRLLRFLHQ